MPSATVVAEMLEAAGRMGPAVGGSADAARVVFTGVFDRLCAAPAAAEDLLAGAMPSPNNADGSLASDADPPVAPSEDPRVAPAPADALPVLRASSSGMAYSVPAGLSGW